MNGDVKSFLKYFIEENEHYLVWLKVFNILLIDKKSHRVIADSNEKTYTDELVPVKNILTKMINVFFDFFVIMHGINIATSIDFYILL